jgi:hypothetical protein
MESIDIVIPCISVEKGISTSRINRAALKRYFDIVNVVIVVDTPEIRHHQSDSRDLIIYTGGGYGSYKARNLGVIHSSGSQNLLFIDDDVQISGEISLPRKYGICGVNIVFRNNPNNDLEEWYKLNAFDIVRFSEKFNFVPTICMFVERRVYEQLKGFDERLLSAGDMNFCLRAIESKIINKVSILSGVNCTTSIRKDSKIPIKITRQIIGQCIEIQIRKGFILGKFNIFIRIIYLIGKYFVNIFPVKNSEKIILHIKIKFIIIAFFSSFLRLKKMMIDVNNIEISK